MTVQYLRFGRRLSIQQTLKSIFSRKIWLSKSSIGDLKLFVFNRILFGGILTSFVSKSAIGLSVYFWLLNYSWYPNEYFSQLPDFAPPLIFTACLFIFDDYSRYWVHRLMHQLPFLWEFHKTHHSATSLTPLTVFRTHPLEAVIFSLRGGVVQGLLIGFAFSLFGTQLSLATILGANALSVIFHSVGSNLRHSHIVLRYPASVERWLISPAQHQIHHSTAAQHFDKNFGVAFACWDRLHGTLHASERKRLKFGLPGTTKNKGNTIVSLVFGPFQIILQRLSERFSCSSTHPKNQSSPQSKRFFQNHTSKSC